MSEGTMIGEQIQKVRAEIMAARARRTHVSKDAPVELIAVTKNHPVAAMQEAIDAGIMNIGENRIQEALDKAETRQFDLIHSVDSVHLAQAVNRAAEKFGKVQNILVQVNLAREESKSGVYREDLDELLAAIDGMDSVRLQGFMCIAPNYENVEQCRSLFREMYELFRQMKAAGPRTADIRYLSMGMTHDYGIAVEEGANLVRVGTAIFGARQYTLGV